VVRPAGDSRKENGAVADGCGEGGDLLERVGSLQGGWVACGRGGGGP
jgi:hypothetical protein